MNKEPDTSAEQNSDNVVVRVMRDFRSALTSPNVFFAGLDYDGPLLEPFVFHMIVCVVNALGSFLVASWKLKGLYEGFLWMFLGGFITVGFFYLAGRLFDGDADNKTTIKQLYRGVAFAMGPLLFAWIPLLLVICYVYALFLFHKVISSVLKLTEKQTNMVLGSYVAMLALLGLGWAAYSLTKIFGAKSAAGLD